MDRRSFLAGLALLSAAGCMPRKSALTVASKNFTEQLVLGELLAQVLEGVCRQPVERRFYLAGTYICHQALLAGRIDVYVEYTGTALAAILKEHPSGDSQSVYRQVKDRYLHKFGLDVMPPPRVARGSRRLGVRSQRQRRCPLPRLPGDKRGEDAHPLPVPAESGGAKGRRPHYGRLQRSLASTFALKPIRNT